MGRASFVREAKIFPSSKLMCLLMLHGCPFLEFLHNAVHFSESIKPFRTKRDAGSARFWTRIQNEFLEPAPALQNKKPLFSPVQGAALGFSRFLIDSYTVTVAYPQITFNTPAQEAPPTKDARSLSGAGVNRFVFQGVIISMRSCSLQTNSLLQQDPPDFPHREPHYIAVVPNDSFYKDTRPALDTVPAGLIKGLAGADIGFNFPA